MKKLKLFYNPYSGEKDFRYELDTALNILQDMGYTVTFYRLDYNHTIENDFKNNDNSIYDAFVISGGDGTINTFVNVLMKYKLNHIPFGILPKGTANDFATYLSIPRSTEEALKIMHPDNIHSYDAGKANDKYFINVCAAGLFSNVSSQVDKNIKNTLGTLAYYLKGIEQIPNFEPFKVSIKTDTMQLQEELILFLILNSSGTAGLKNIVPDAKTNDGYFDFIGFKTGKIKDYPRLLYKFFKGEHLEENSVVYLKEKRLYINSDINKLTDLDGEMGPTMPIEVLNLHNALKIFTIEKGN